MVNINAQQWLDEKYPIDGVCKRDNDPENKGKRREDITELDLSKGKIGSKRNNKNLFGSLKLTGFTKLRTLICSSQQLTELDVSECPNLIELDCRYNELNTLNVNNCSYLEKLDCSNNYLRALDVSYCSELKELTCYSNKLSKDNVIFLSPNTKLILVQETEDNQPLIVPATEHDIRNILLVGWTGNGKSTLANVLTDTNQFVEKNCGASVTTNFQKSKIFDWRGKKYCIIDNIGFGDTSSLAEEDILFKIGDGIHSAKEGINQVLFVVKGRFSDNQIEAFNLFKDFISETGITRFTTIVRTGFENFRSPQKCEEDKQTLLDQKEELRKIIESCNDNIIYVNNPPIPEIDEEEDEEEEIEDKKQEMVTSERKRKESREKVLNHLSRNCLEIYKIKEWDSIYSMVDNYIKRKKEIEQSNSPTKEEQLKKEWNEVTKGIKVGLGFELPTFGGFNASVEYSTQKKKYSPSQTHSQPTYIGESSFNNFLQLQNSQETNTQFLGSQNMEIEDESTTKNKRSLSISSQTKTSREKNKMFKVEEELEQMEVDELEQITQVEIPPKK